MTELNKKVFLDEAGLKLYDELIKAYIDKANEKDQQSVSEILDTLVNLSASVTENATAIETLTGEGEGSVKKAVDDAVAGLVNGAPEALDTLKEISDWIATDEAGSAQLVAKVEALEEADEVLKALIENGDANVYASIQSIEDLKIMALFPIKQSEGKTVAETIGEMEDGDAIELIANQTVTDDLAITKSCYINANGAIFEGTVKVPANAEVIIENATFSKPVVVE